jgi:hypothetical protein
LFSAENQFKKTYSAAHFAVFWTLPPGEAAPVAPPSYARACGVWGRKNWRYDSFLSKKLRFRLSVPFHHKTVISHTHPPEKE